MKHEKAFTLIELLVCIVIVGAIAAITYSFANPSSFDEDNSAFINPEYATARATQKMARELERQNDIKERELNSKAEKE